ncbi:MAG: hypothetical protein R2939_20665 [Kofleriaceae bacterium]
MSARRLALAVAASAIAACGHPPPPPPVTDDARPRRVIEPPPDEVHALPPFAIRPDGVGPYRLDAPLSTVLAALPSGPRGVAVLDLPGVVRLSVIRAEDDKLIVGGEPMATTSFVAVVGGDVARTEHELAVGSTADELRAALGAPAAPVDLLADPRLGRFPGAPGVRFLVERDRVAAIVVAPPDTSTLAPVVDTCDRTVAEPPASGRVAVRDGRPSARGACLAGRERVVVAGEQVVVTSADLAQRITAAAVPGLVFAEPARGEGKDELVVVRGERSPAKATWWVSTWRLEGGRLSRGLEEVLYEITAASAQWIGARVAELDLALEVAVRPDALVAGGLLLARAGDRLRDVVPLVPVTVARRRRTAVVPVTPGGGGDARDAKDAGVTDATPPTRDGRPRPKPED